jgi:acetyl-CoA carboxylase biotin carboxyl carrier protein
LAFEKLTLSATGHFQSETGSKNALAKTFKIFGILGVFTEFNGPTTRKRSRSRALPRGSETPLFVGPHRVPHHKGPPLDLKEIKQIIDLMKRSDLTEFAVEEEGFKLRIRRGNSGPPVVSASNVGFSSVGPAAESPASGTVASPAGGATGSPVASLRPAPPADEPGVAFIKSPMVGTFYRAPSPESPSFVEPGSKITETSPVCIIEAMKIMNEIQAEVKGTILEVLIENGQPVEFGQRLFKVRLG